MGQAAPRRTSVMQCLLQGIKDEPGMRGPRHPPAWSRSYFAATVGAVSEATIRRYIASQKGM
jgi:REP element-mobilizing transposase RayT